MELDQPQKYGHKYKENVKKSTKELSAQVSL